MPYYNVILAIFLLSTSLFLLIIVPFPWNVMVFTVCFLADISIIRKRIKERKAEKDSGEGDEGEDR